MSNSTPLDSKKEEDRMRKTMLAAGALALGFAGATAVAQTATPGQGMGDHRSGAMMDQRGSDMPMMHGGQGGGHDMMGRGMMGGMAPMMMAMMDANGNGTLSLAEINAVHERLFGYADTDDDGELTLEEMRGFMGAAMAAPAQ